MKKIIKNRNITFLLILISVFSCKKPEDFLETINKETLTDASMWINEGNSDIFLNSVYKDLPTRGNQADNMDNYTDDATMPSYYTSHNWKKGLVDATTNNYTIWGGQSGPAFDANWPQTYKIIRKLNTFIQKVNENSKNFSAEYKAKRIDEAKVLRAFFYSELFMRVGGLSIITVPQDRTTMSKDELNVPRKSFEETFNFIISELDAVVKNGKLEVKYDQGDPNAGRATLGVALALKGWIELFAASPAYNSSSPAIPAGSDKLQSFANPDPKRWANAAATNKKFIDTYGHKGSGKYSLFPRMSQFWWEANEYNSEVIWDRQHVSVTIPNTYDDFGGPTWVLGTYLTWGNYNPTQEVVDDYQMNNGKNITDPTSGYDPQKPYVGREARFYDFIVYDGAPYKQDWMPTTDIIYTRIDKVNRSDNEVDFGGEDATQTGYFYKKRLDNLHSAGGGLSGQNYVFYRYAEVLLNYAEAQNEAVGPDASVYEAMNNVRTRPGTDLPALQPGLSKEQMRIAVYRERRIELVHEGKRLYDLWRWKLADINLNKSLHGMKITNSVPNNNSGKWVYEIFDTGYEHVFTQKMYFNPIPQAAIDQNSNLKQNFGY